MAARKSHIRPLCFVVLAVMVSAGCQQPAEPYRLHLRTEPGGEVLVGVSGCQGDGYEGEIVEMSMTIADLNDYLAGRALYRALESADHPSVVTRAPHDLAEQLTAPIDDTRKVVAVEFSVQDEGSAPAPHTASLSLGEAVDEMGVSGQATDDSWCRWAP